VLRHLSARHALGDELALDADAAHSAVQRIAGVAGLSLEEAALGILHVAEATMARAIRRISVERGHDPRDFTLVSFGGAGGLHAARLAELMGIRTVLLPRDPGLLSAVGMLRAAPLHTFSQGVMLRIAPENAAKGELLRHYAVRRTMEELALKAEQALRDEGIPENERVYSGSLDMRYAGQSYEITVQLSEGDPARAFAAQHQRLYGYTAPEKALEIVALRLQAGACERPLSLLRLRERRGAIPIEAVETAPVWEKGREVMCARMRRDSLLFGDIMDGPAIVDEYSATTLVPGGWGFQVNALGQLMLHRLEDLEAGL
jgi:N-methylhydantoinase A